MTCGCYRFSTMCGCHRFSAACGCHLLSAACGCRRLSAVFVCNRCCASFIYVMAIQTSKVYSIKYKKSNQLSSIYCKIGMISILITIVILTV